MKSTIRFAPAVAAVTVVASLAVALLTADAGAQVRKPVREGFPGGIPSTDWPIWRSRLPLRFFSIQHARGPIEVYRRKFPLEEYHPLATTGGRAGW